MATFQAEILEVVHPLGVYELHVLPSGPPVGVAQVTLQRHVIVFDGATSEPMLEYKKKVKEVAVEGLRDGCVPLSANV